MKKIDEALAHFVIGLIKIYQHTISPDHSPLGKCFPYRGCKFHPTCSMYAISSFEKKGFVKGLGASLKRFGKCHPWSDGGVDLPGDL